MTEEEIITLVALLEERGLIRRREGAGGAISDAVAQSSLVVAEAPVVATASSDLATGTALSMAAQNATNHQAAGSTQLHASTVVAVQKLLQPPRRTRVTLTELIELLAE